MGGVSSKKDIYVRRATLEILTPDGGQLREILVRFVEIASANPEAMFEVHVGHVERHEREA